MEVMGCAKIYGVNVKKKGRCKMKTKTLRKGVFAVVAALAVGFAFAAEGDVTVDTSTGRLVANGDLRGITFDSSGLGSGSVGYIAYYGKGETYKKEIEIGVATSTKSLKSSDSVGFYYISSSGATVTSDSLVEVGEGEYKVVFGGGTVGGDALTIKNVRPTGQPLPGFLAILLVGGAGAGALKLRKSRS